MRRNGDTLAEVLNSAQKYFPVPAKYEHKLIMPTELFIKIWEFDIINFSDFNIDDTIRYQESNGVITLSFINSGVCNLIHIKALEYILKEISLPSQRISIIRTDNVKKQLKPFNKWE